MPRYFFHIDNGTFAPDPVGLDHPDLQSVRLEAVRAAGSMIGEHSEALWEHLQPFHMHVVDSVDRLLFTLEFSAKVLFGDVLFIPRIKDNPSLSDAT